MSLGQQLADTGDAIVELILATEDRNEKKKLREQLAIISDTTDKLIRANVNSDTEQYLAVTDSLNAANEKIKAATEDLAKVADSIVQIAKVIETLGKLAVML
jgi:hypothetical protein